MSVELAAIKYAEQGFRVIQLRDYGDERNRRAPLQQGWPEVATNDAEAIEELWGDKPGAGIGIACGHDDLFVLDVDVKGGKNGAATLAKLVAENNGDFPLTLSATTPSGGTHYYLRAPGIGNSVCKIGDGLDIRGRHGYVVAPSEAHPDYQWINEGDDIADAPAWLVDAIRKASGSASPTTTHTATASETADAEQVQALRSALTFMHEHADNYGTWIDVGHDLKALGATGFELWFTWSQFSPRFDAAEATKKWATLKASRSGFRNVYRRASDIGWVNTGSGSMPAALPAEAYSAAPEPHGAAALPPHAAAFLDLHGELGAIQSCVKSRLIFPDDALAGVITLAIMAHFCGRHLTVQGLKRDVSLCLYLLAMLKTGGGKESARQTLIDVNDFMLTKHPDALRDQHVLKLPKIAHEVPGSEQMLHKMIAGAGGALTIVADEFGDTLRSAATDKSKAAALAALKDITGRHNGTYEAPASLAGEKRGDAAIRNPRVSTVATATPARVIDSMTTSDAEGGFWNRWVMVPLDSSGEKSYVWSGDDVETPPPPARVSGFLAWILSLPAQVIKLDDGAKREFERQDKERTIPIAARDPMLGGRLGEHVLKIAAYIALGARRTTVTADDVAAAFVIRISLYERAHAAVGDHGGLDSRHPSVRAVAKLTSLFERRAAAYEKDLVAASAEYRDMSLRDREQVLSTLKARGVFETKGKKLVSLIHRPEATPP
jgi:hypothetical protein